jgi:hypothetical protein
MLRGVWRSEGHNTIRFPVLGLDGGRVDVK